MRRVIAAAVYSLIISTSVAPAQVGGEGAARAEGPALLPVAVAEVAHSPPVQLRPLHLASGHRDQSTLTRSATMSMSIHPASACRGQLPAYPLPRRILGRPTIRGNLSRRRRGEHNPARPHRRDRVLRRVPIAMATRNAWRCGAHRTQACPARNGRRPAIRPDCHASSKFSQSPPPGGAKRKGGGHAGPPPWAYICAPLSFRGS